MARFLVNPGTPQEWEIQLKPGPNRLGRGDNNDFTIPHGSVSGSHCEVILSDSGALLRDLGSTNGTFINRSPVKEANLQPGHRVQLGAVDMLFEQTVAGPAPMVNVATAAAPPPPPMASPPIPPPVSAPARSGALRISVTPKAPVAAAPVVEAAPEDAVVEAEHTAFVRAPMAVGAAFCKFHPKSPARFYCNKCQKYFCDMCVTARATAAGQMKTCRACGQEVTAVQVQRVASGGEKGFFARIPSAFIYPFKGSGLLVLIFATVVFTVLDFLNFLWFLFLLRILITGYLFCFMQNVIHTTVADENESLSMPAADGLFAAFFAFVGTVLVSFGPPIGIAVANIFFEAGIPVIAIVATAVGGCFYFPMAFLAVAMKDTVMAANPLVVIPAILKVPLQYLVTAFLLIGVYAIRMGGDMIISLISPGLAARDMSDLVTTGGLKVIWSFVSIYLLVVNMRILAFLYLTNKQKFGWFSR